MNSNLAKHHTLWAISKEWRILLVDKGLRFFLNLKAFIIDTEVTNILFTFRCKTGLYRHTEMGMN